MGIYTATPPTLADGQQAEAQMDASGRLIVASTPSSPVGATFTRPANTTAYASGQLVANSVTAGSVVPMQFSAARVAAGTGMVRRARISTSKTGLAGTEVIRLHLFKLLPTPVNGDGAAFSVNGIAAIHIGYFDVTMDRVFTDGSKGFGVPAVGSEITFDAAAGSQIIYGLLEARGTFTLDSAGTLNVALEVLRD